MESSGSSKVSELAHARALLAEQNAAVELAAVEAEIADARANLAMESLRIGTAEFVNRFDFAPVGYGFQQSGPYGGMFSLSSSTDRVHGRDYPWLVSESDIRNSVGLARLVTKAHCPGVAIERNLKSHVIGKGGNYTAGVRKGLKVPDGLLDAIQDLVDEFIDENKIIGDGEHEWYWRGVRDGETIIGLYPMPKGRHGIVDAREIEPLQVCTPGKAPLSEDEIVRRCGHDISCATNWEFGVHKADHDAQQIFGYAIEYDGDWDYLPTRYVGHWKRNVDRNVCRGVTDFYQAWQWIEQQSRLLGNTSAGAAERSAIAYIVQHIQGVTQSKVRSMRSDKADATYTYTGPSGATKQFNRENIPPGSKLDIPKGQEYVAIANGTDPSSAYISVLQAISRQVGIVWNMPEGMISGDDSGASVTASVVAGSRFDKFATMEQGAFGSFMLNILWKVIKFAYDRGRLEKFGYSRDKDGSFYQLKKKIELIVKYPDVSNKHPIETEQLRQIRKQNGVLSTKTWTDEVGLDYETEQKNIQEEQQQQQGQGGGPGGPGGGMPPGMPGADQGGGDPPDQGGMPGMPPGGQPPMPPDQGGGFGGPPGPQAPQQNPFQQQMPPGYEPYIESPQPGEPIGGQTAYAQQGGGIGYRNAPGFGSEQFTKSLATVVESAVAKAVGRLADDLKKTFGEGDLVLESSPGWQAYNGPRGGKGWKSLRTGRVLYQIEMPGVDGHEGVSDESKHPMYEVGYSMGSTTKALRRESLVKHGYDPSDNKAQNAFSSGASARDVQSLQIRKIKEIERRSPFMDAAMVQAREFFEAGNEEYDESDIRDKAEEFAGEMADEHDEEQSRDEREKKQVVVTSNRYSLANHASDKAVKRLKDWAENNGWDVRFKHESQDGSSQYFRLSKTFNPGTDEERDEEFRVRVSDHYAPHGSGFNQGTGEHYNKPDVNIVYSTPKADKDKLESESFDVNSDVDWSGFGIDTDDLDSHVSQYNSATDNRGTFDQSSKKITESFFGHAGRPGEVGGSVSRSKPWEMTQSQYRDSHPKVVAAVKAMQKAFDSLGSVMRHENNRGEWFDEGSKAAAQHENAKSEADSEHKDHVLKALMAGRTVPPHVMADYPHMNPKRVPGVDVTLSDDWKLDYNRLSDSLAVAEAHAPKGFTYDHPLVNETSGRMDCCCVQGLGINVENRAGTERSGETKDGTPWCVTMAHDYGEIISIDGEDAHDGRDFDPVDVFLGPCLDSELVFVVDQYDYDGSFDEHKCMLGWTNADSAAKAYCKNYDDHRECGPITPMTMAEFKEWLRNPARLHSPVSPNAHIVRDECDSEEDDHEAMIHRLSILVADLDLDEHEVAAIVSDLVGESDVNQWMAYRGPRGGHGWKSMVSGRVIYQIERPGGSDHDGVQQDEPSEETSRQTHRQLFRQALTNRGMSVPEYSDSEWDSIDKFLAAPHLDEHGNVRIGGSVINRAKKLANRVVNGETSLIPVSDRERRRQEEENRAEAERIRQEESMRQYEIAQRESRELERIQRQRDEENRRQREELDRQRQEMLARQREERERVERERKEADAIASKQREATPSLTPKIGKLNSVKREILDVAKTVKFENGYSIDRPRPIDEDDIDYDDVKSAMSDEDKKRLDEYIKDKINEYVSSGLRDYEISDDDIAGEAGSDNRTISTDIDDIIRNKVSDNDVRKALIEENKEYPSSHGLDGIDEIFIKLKSVDDVPDELLDAIEEYKDDVAERMDQARSNLVEQRESELESEFESDEEDSLKKEWIKDNSDSYL